ncbi:MAG TPA: hypothetical protein VFH45_11835, partial [Acidimicrobiales bacterium]|nr:hypothetical protein [Acidimicrobiales bacterium]
RGRDDRGESLLSVVGDHIDPYAAGPAPGPDARSAYAPRPGHIARTPQEVSELLAEAEEESWPVRLSYVNGKGRESQYVGQPIGVNRRFLILSCFPRGGAKELVVNRIEWARVLTEAEEEAL